jgi:hypothetical protein
VPVKINATVITGQGVVHSPAVSFNITIEPDVLTGHGIIHAPQAGFPGVVIAKITRIKPLIDVTIVSKEYHEVTVRTKPLHEVAVATHLEE